MGSRATAAILRGRRQAERLMIMRCTVDRVVGETTDPDTDKGVPLVERVYTGKCKVTSYEGYEQERDVAGFAATVQRLSVHFPVGSFQVRVGDVVTVTESPLDARLVGKKYRAAQEAPYRTFATADRVFVDAMAS